MYCPECGNFVGEGPATQYQQPVRSEYPSYVYALWFFLGLLVAFGVTLLLGRMMMFLFIPFLFFGGRKSRSNMFFIGAMVGSLLQLLVVHLL